MHQPKAKMNLRRITLAAILSVGMAFGPVSTVAFAEEGLGDEGGVGLLSAAGYEDEDQLDLEAQADDPKEVQKIFYYRYTDADKTLRITNKPTDGYQMWDTDNTSSTSWSSHAGTTEVVKIESELVPASTEDWFSGFTALKKIEGLGKIATTHIKEHSDPIETESIHKVSNMFKNCSKLTSLDLRNFEPSDNTTMAGMFDGCTGLLSVRFGEKWRFNDSSLPAGKTWCYEKSSLVKTSEQLADQWSKPQSDAISALNSDKWAGTWYRDDVRIVELVDSHEIRDPDDIIGTYGTTATLPPRSDTSNYKFKGWNTKRDGSGTSYNSSVKLDSDLFGSTERRSITLYAIWDDTSTSYKITFDPNGAPGMTAFSVDAAKDVATTISKLATTEFSWDGHEFVEWNTASDGKATSYGKDASITPNRDMTLYAQWKKAVNVSATGVLDIKQTNLKDVADTALTNTEKEQGVEFWLEASALSAEELAARQSDVDLLNTAATVRDAENQLFFDISLYKKVGTAEKEKITSKLATKAKFTITVPEAYKAPSDVTRTFYLLRCHDGEATVAGQSTSMTISAEADGFSTFALAYNDTAKSTSTNKTTTPTTTTTTTRTTTPTTSTTTRSTTPATGDDSMPVAIIGAAAALGVAAVGFGVYTKRKNN